MQTYIVTGVAGFIASKVAELLLRDGHTVIGIDNLNDAYDIQLKHWRLKQIQEFSNFSWHQIDIADREQISTLFASLAGKPIAGIINLAARAGVRPSVENPWVYIDTNVTGTLNLLEMCRQHKIPKFVLSSTSSLYGNRNPQPYQEDANTDYPLSPYAASKKAAETFCYTYHHLHGLDVTVLRYFTVYGPAGRPDMAPFRFVQWISEGRPLTVYGDGQQSRDFTYVDDIARGTIAALKPVGYDTFNLGSDTPVVLMDAIRLMERAIGKEANIQYQPMHSADMSATWADIQKTRSILGWEPQVTFEDGVNRLVEWYKENRDWAQNVETG